MSGGMFAGAETVCIAFRLFCFFPAPSYREVKPKVKMSLVGYMPEPTPKLAGLFACENSQCHIAVADR